MDCQICRGFGKIHPRLSSGKVDSSSLVFCACQNDKAGQVASKALIIPDELEHYYKITPSDFDFPVSWDMHRWIETTYGKGDPGPCEPTSIISQESQPQRITHVQYVYGKYEAIHLRKEAAKRTQRKEYQGIKE